jgi:hypothetical protein
MMGQPATTVGHATPGSVVFGSGSYFTDFWIARPGNASDRIKQEG